MTPNDPSSAKNEPQRDGFDRAGLTARYEHFQRLAVQSTNLGGSGDDQDLYRVLDDLIDEVQAHHPPFACRAGCTRCCVTMPPLVLGVEWGPIHRYLQAHDDVRERVLEFAELLRPLAQPLALMRELALAKRPLPNDFGFQCPMLLDGKCSIYPVRPLVCRAYGYVYRIEHGRTGPETRLLMSDLGMAYVRAHWGGQDSHLPVINAYRDQLENLNRAIGGGEAFFPQWLWAHMADGGGLVAEPDPAPDFAAR